MKDTREIAVVVKVVMDFHPLMEALRKALAALEEAFPEQTEAQEAG